MEADLAYLEQEIELIVPEIGEDRREALMELFVRFIAEEFEEE